MPTPPKEFKIRFGKKIGGWTVSNFGMYYRHYFLSSRFLSKNIDIEKDLMKWSWFNTDAKRHFNLARNLYKEVRNAEQSKRRNTDIEN